MDSQCGWEGSSSQLPHGGRATWPTQGQKKQFQWTGRQDNLNQFTREVQRWQISGCVSCGSRNKSVCVCVFISYLMRDHDGEGWRGGELRRQPAYWLERRRRWMKKKRRRTGLLYETLPFHGTSFPPATGKTPLWLNLSRPQRKG